LGKNAGFIGKIRRNAPNSSIITVKSLVLNQLIENEVR